MHSTMSVHNTDPPFVSVCYCVLYACICIKLEYCTRRISVEVSKKTKNYCRSRINDFRILSRITDFSCRRLFENWFWVYSNRTIKMKCVWYFRNDARHNWSQILVEIAFTNNEISVLSRQNSILFMLVQILKRLA